MIPRITPAELHELARSWGFDADDAETEQLLTVADSVFEAFDLLESQEGVGVEPVRAVRDSGRRPTGGEDPLNAIVRLCRVRVEDAEGVLSGKRIAVKDAVAVAGIPLTCGSRVLQGYVPAEDSIVTDRILRAGGEIVAITNMDDLAFSGGGDSSCYGATLNPWDRTRAAGGSSGGSAAVLFYDDAAVGADQGGSIRAPASWCGVVGLKPTHGLVPYVGIAGIDQTFDQCGPMGRTCADVAALLQAIAGEDDADPRQRDVRTGDYAGASRARRSRSRAYGSLSSRNRSATRSASSRRPATRWALRSSGCGNSVRSRRRFPSRSTCRPAASRSSASSRE